MFLVIHFWGEIEPYFYIFFSTPPPNSFLLYYCEGSAREQFSDSAAAVEIDEFFLDGPRREGSNGNPEVDFHFSSRGVAEFTYVTDSILLVSSLAVIYVVVAGRYNSR